VRAFCARVVQFATRRVRWSSRAQQATFTEIYRARRWGNGESVSGPGSSRARAAAFKADLVALLTERRIRSILDAPCGDFNWMREVLDGVDVHYTGVDIVEELIAANRREYERPDRQFLCADLTRAALPAADLVICRDGLVHLSFADALAAMRNFRRSGSRYLLATTFVGRERNRDVATGGWRPLNMERAPFALSPPLALVDERCTHSDGIYRDKRMGLWPLR